MIKSVSQRHKKFLLLVVVAVVFVVVVVAQFAWPALFSKNMKSCKTKLFNFMQLARFN